MLARATNNQSAYMNELSQQWQSDYEIWSAGRIKPENIYLEKSCRNLYKKTSFTPHFIFKKILYKVIIQMVRTSTSICFNNPGQRFKIETDRIKMQSIDIEICMISFCKKGISFFKTTSA